MPPAKRLAVVAQCRALSRSERRAHGLEARSAVNTVTGVGAVDTPAATVFLERRAATVRAVGHAPHDNIKPAQYRRNRRVVRSAFVIGRWPVRQIKIAITP